MNRLLIAAILALMPIVGAATKAQAGTPPPATLYIAAVDAEPGPPVVQSDVTNESLLVLADVRYRGPAPWWLNIYNFSVVTPNGVAYSPQSYDGVLPLRTEKMISPGRDAGWLLFTIPKTDARNLTLTYELTLPKSDRSSSKTTVLIETRPFTPRLSPTWSYATAARQSLLAYVRDEAQVAGYLAMAAGTLFNAGRSVSVAMVDRRYLRQALTLLRNDHSAFDRVAASGAAAGLKARANAAFTAIETDLTAVASIRTSDAWTAWQASFAADNRALADVYQNWPGSSLL